MNSVDAVWRDLVRAALLGTDRRPPPNLEVDAVADLVDDSVESDDAVRLLTAVASVAAVRRAGFVGGPAAAPLQPPAPDDRPWCPPVAVQRWRAAASDWPVLTDEWVLGVIQRGWRLSPDVLAELLIATRSDPVRRARVLVAGGPAAEWLVDQVPGLVAASGRPAPAESVAELPELPIPPELAALLALDADTVATRLAAGVAEGGYGAAHRPVLINLLARCRPDVLPVVADRLGRIPSGLAASLAALARARAAMLTPFEPGGAGAVEG